MCGIAGIFHFDTAPVDAAVIRRMTRVQQHRGPDDEHVVLHAGAALGHRRLRILDTSDRGRQPMASADKRYWITYNGEVYNYRELREDLRSQGYYFASDSDTEVVLAAFQEHGPPCVELFRGMFAFAILDTEERILFCARDRFGIKPFVYRSIPNGFIFASEEKALLEHPQVDARLDRSTVFDFLCSGYGYADLDERTFFEDIRQLPPATTLTVHSDGRLEQRRYWQLSLEQNERVSPEQLLEAVRESVRLRLISDVPVGTALSGGIDSSIVTCIAARELGQTLQTFSAYFEDKDIDEREYVRAVLQSSDAISHTVRPPDEGLADTLGTVMWHLDRPYAGPSVYAQWHVAKLSREAGVPVMLNGQGGDELFAGYRKYATPFLVSLLRGGRWSRARAERASLRDSGIAPPWRHVVRLALREALPLRLGAPVDPVVHPSLARHHTRFRPQKPRSADLVNRELAEALRVSPLPALLRNDDRNGMAHGVESRQPFLDYPLVELAFRIPGEQKIRGGLLKAPLRDAFQGVIPASVLSRRDKLGFATPDERWVRTVLVDPMRDLLSSRWFRELELLDDKVVLREPNTRDPLRTFSWYALAVFCEQFFSNDKRMLVWDDSVENVREA